jgi:hypothetical protein
LSKPDETGIEMTPLPFVSVAVFAYRLLTGNPLHGEGERRPLIA